MSSTPSVSRLVPGILLCVAVTVVASLLQAAEVSLVGEPYLEALVLAILLGVSIRTAWTPGLQFRAGIGFSAKTLLEVAVVMLGASVSARTVLALGPALLGGIVLVVAVAPVIGADGDDIASSIAFTAVLGVIVVLLLPLLVPILAMSLTQYGVLAGLTVYAVPQVLAATLPIGALSNQVGTVVKLVRVLMLGPVVLALSLLTRRLRDEPDEAAPAVTAGDRPKRGRPALGELVPWFIVGFLVVLALRSAGVIPARLLRPLALTANLLTTVSMAALGLGVDVRVVAKAGVRVTAAVTLSLVVLGVISLGLIHLLDVA